MDLRQLEYFVTVVDERSFSRGALRLHVAQSTISAGIQALERDLGAALIIRTTRQFQLTPAGAELLARGRELLAAERAATSAVLAAAGTVAGQLRLGTPASTVPFDVPALLGRYHVSYPKVDIRLATSAAGSAGLRQGVLDGTLDAAFSSAGAAHAGLHTREVATTPVDLIVASGHRLAGRTQVSLADIADEAFIDFPAGFGQRTVTDTAFEQAGISRRIALEVTTASAAADFARHGLGVALLPRSAVRVRNGIARIRLDNPVPQWRIYFSHHADRWQSPALSALLRMLNPEPGCRDHFTASATEPTGRQ